MVWKCPPLHLPNWNNLWKWKQEMNAYELADYVDAREINNPHLKEAATMLRQQQTEIESLKKECAWAKDQWNKDRICFESRKQVNERDYSFMKDLAIGEESRAKELEAEIEELKKELKRTKFAWNLAENLLEEYRDDNRTSESFDRTASHMAGEYVAQSTCNRFCGEYECKENKEGCKRNE